MTRIKMNMEMAAAETDTTAVARNDDERTMIDDGWR